MKQVHIQNNEERIKRGAVFLKKFQQKEEKLAELQKAYDLQYVAVARTLREDLEKLKEADGGLSNPDSYGNASMIRENQGQIENELVEELNELKNIYNENHFIEKSIEKEYETQSALLSIEKQSDIQNERAEQHNQICQEALHRSYQERSQKLNEIIKQKQAELQAAQAEYKQSIDKLLEKQKRALQCQTIQS